MREGEREGKFAKLYIFQEQANTYVNKQQQQQKLMRWAKTKKKTIIGKISTGFGSHIYKSIQKRESKYLLNHAY